MNDRRRLDSGGMGGLPAGMTRHVQRFGSAVRDGALGLAVLTLLAVTLPGLALCHTTVIRGGSMGSALPPGSIAVSRTVPASHVRDGDIIAVGHSASGMPTFHRVVSIKESAVGRTAITQGDANASADAEPITMTGEGDRLVYHVPYVGYLLWWLRTPIGMSCAAAVCAWCLRNWPVRFGHSMRRTPKLVR